MVFVFFLTFSEVYINDNVVYDISSNGDSVFLSTNGGVVFYSYKEDRLLKHLTKAQGLNSNRVFALVYDKGKGRLFLGEEKGIQYVENGKVYSVENVPYIVINDMSEYNSSVAAGSNQGVYLMEYESGGYSIKYFSHALTGLTSDTINSVILIKDTLFIATFKGLNIVNVKSGFNRVVNAKDTVYNMFFFNDTLYCVLPSGVFYLQNDSLEEFISFPSLFDKSAAMSVYKNRFYFSDNSYLYSFKNDTIDTIKIAFKTDRGYYKLFSNITAMHVDNGMLFLGNRPNKGDLWGDGLYIYGKRHVVFPSLNSNCVRKIGFDKSGGVWLTHHLWGYSNGVTHVFDCRIENLTASGDWLSDYSQYALAYNERFLALAGMWYTSYIDIYDFSDYETYSFQIHNYSIDNVVIGMSFYEDTMLYVFSHKDANAPIRLYTYKGELVNEIIYNYAPVNDVCTKNDTLVLATEKGLVFYDIKQDKFLSFDVSSSGLPDNDISSVVINKGEIWGGTRQGLFKFKNESIVVFNKTNTPFLSSNVVVDIASDELGRLWILTDRGLDLFDPQTNKWVNYLQENTSIPDGELSTVAVDTLLHKVVVGSMDGGISVFYYANDSIVSNDKIDIYPNPFIGSRDKRITVKAPQNSSVKLFNLNGAFLDDFSFSDVENAYILFPDISSGLYVVVVKSKNGIYYKRLVVLK